MMVCTVFIILAMTVISSMNASNLVVNSTRDLLAEKAGTFYAEWGTGGRAGRYYP